MLVLTRRIGEEIVIDGAIRVTVVAVRGKKIRIGVSAPDSVRVDRAEIDLLRSSSGFERTLRDEATPPNAAQELAQLPRRTSAVTRSFKRPVSSQSRS